MHKVFLGINIVASFLVCSRLCAQSEARICFLNGKVIYVYSLSFDSITIRYQIKESKKQKMRSISTAHVFSIYDSNGFETVFYSPQNENDRQLEDMRQFIQGQADARDNRQSNARARWWFIAGVASGSALGFVVHTDILLAPLPIAFPIIAHYNGVNPNAYQLVGKSQAYIEGFEKEIRSKKVYRALQGAIIGSLSGLIISNTIR